jgi:transposase-like protein
MGTLMDDEIKRWTARRQSALVLEIIQGKTTVAEASRAHDLPPSELEKWIEDGKRGMENALRANPQDVREQYEKQLKDLQEAYGEAMLELRVRKKLQSLLGEDAADGGHGAIGWTEDPDHRHDAQPQPCFRDSTGQPHSPVPTCFSRAV